MTGEMLERGVYFAVAAALALVGASCPDSRAECVFLGFISGMAFACFLWHKEPS
jgi:hypothetical protein